MENIEPIPDFWALKIPSDPESKDILQKWRAEKWPRRYTPDNKIGNVFLYFDGSCGYKGIEPVSHVFRAHRSAKAGSTMGEITMEQFEFYIVNGNISMPEESTNNRLLELLTNCVK